jgi:hypothetical protein
MTSLPSRPARSQPRFEVGQSLNPYPIHYGLAFARFASGLLYPLHHPPSLRSGYRLAVGYIGLACAQLIVRESRTRVGGVFIPEGAKVSLPAELSDSPPLVPFGHSLSAALAVSSSRDGNASLSFTRLVLP